jgi:hypothetical protein
MDIPIGKVLNTENGFLIRPFVHLRAKQKGYMWTNQLDGLWTSFLNCHYKNFTGEITGNSLLNTNTSSTFVANANIMLSLLT